MTCSEHTSRPTCDERGSAHLVMILGIMGFWVYFAHARATLYAVLGNKPRVTLPGKSIILTTENFPIINLTIIVVLTLVTLLAVGASAHQMSVGGSPSRVRRKTIKKARVVENITIDCLRRLQRYENRMAERHLHGLTSKACTNISLAKDILRALEDRLEEVSSFLSSRKSSHIYYAADLFSQPLNFHDNCLETLLYTERSLELPTLLPSDCGPILDDLFLAIELEIAAAEEELEEKRQALETERQIQDGTAVHNKPKRPRKPSLTSGAHPAQYITRNEK